MYDCVIRCDERSISSRLGQVTVASGRLAPYSAVRIKHATPSASLPRTRDTCVGEEATACRVQVDSRHGSARACIVPLIVALVSAIGAIVAALIVKPTPPPSQWSATIDDCAVVPSPSSIDVVRIQTTTGFGTWSGSSR